jgi:hypothetical protein
MPSNPRDRPGVPARCDLCGRETAVAKPYTILSRVVPLPEKRSSLEPAATSFLSSETRFRTHDFGLCTRCHGRKIVYLVVALALLAGWIGLAAASKGPGLPLIGLAVILAFLLGAAPFLPVQRLVRRIRRERREAVSAHSPGLRFRIETLTPAAYRMRQQVPQAKIPVKRYPRRPAISVPVAGSGGDRKRSNATPAGRRSPSL